MIRRRFIQCFVCASIIGPARADNFAEAINGDAFIEDGVETHLVDIVAPRVLPESDPYGKEAKAALQTLLALTPLEHDKLWKRDRWGRKAGRVYVDVGGVRRSLQELLVSAGAARVLPEDDDAEFIRRLLKLEIEARVSHRGLWANPRYRVFDALKARGAVGAFNIVEGVVEKTYSGRGRVYLNFGKDYRTDFTVTVRARQARDWKRQGNDLAALAGARLRVRGYVKWINGPSIEASNLTQIEIVNAGGINAAPRFQKTSQRSGRVETVQSP
ncbi:MAG: hypothetical protein GC153_08450 [Alphaproteobacteria bacterium]|nr:hypothetical protein [Alphaproteobacteria bacterium]